MLFVIAGSAGLYLPNLPTIFLSRIALGIAVAFIMTAQTALAGDYFAGEARSALTGLQISARNFGGLVFILLASVVAAVSPRWAFGVYGLALLVLPIAWMVKYEMETATGMSGAGVVRPKIAGRIPVSVSPAEKRMSQRASSQIGLKEETANGTTGVAGAAPALCRRAVSAVEHFCTRTACR